MFPRCLRFCFVFVPFRTRRTPRNHVVFLVLCVYTKKQSKYQRLQRAKRVIKNSYSQRKTLRVYSPVNCPSLHHPSSTEASPTKALEHHWSSYFIPLLLSSENLDNLQSPFNRCSRASRGNEVPSNNNSSFGVLIVCIEKRGFSTRSKMREWSELTFLEITFDRGVRSDRKTQSDSCTLGSE